MSQVYDLEAEEGVLGGMMLTDTAASTGLEILDEADFYRPAHGHIFAAIRSLFERGAPIEVVSVQDELISLGTLDLVGDASVLIKLVSNSVSSAHVGYYAQIVVKHKAARDLLGHLKEIESNLSEGGDPWEQAEVLRSSVDSIGTVLGGQQAMTLSQLRDDPTSHPDWAIEGLMRLDWMALVTGFEGAGKGVLMRTMCMAAAQGYHPLNHRRIPPIRTLVVDVENPSEAILETGEVLEQTLIKACTRDGIEYDEDRCRWWRPRGFDIRNRRDLTHLQREIGLQQPELVCIGPLNRIHQARPGETFEMTASAIIDIFDRLRHQYGFALMIECHARKPDGKNSKDRTLIPMNSQRWLASPDLVYGLRPREDDDRMIDVENQRTRSRVSSAKWPNYIVWDPSWVFSGIWEGSYNA